MINATLVGMIADIARAARIVAYKWPNTLEAEEFESEMLLRLSESPGSVEKLATWEPQKRLNALVRVGHQIAASERDDRDLFSGRFNYSVEEVKKLLSRQALDRELDRFDAATFDVRQAFEALRDTNKNYADAIYQRYVLEVTADKNALTRGLEKLTLLMNRGWATRTAEFHNGNRFRTRQSNEYGAAVVQNDYAGTSDD